MVAKASSVSHGYNAINYAVTKKDAKHLSSNHLSIDSLWGDDDYKYIWQSMQSRHFIQKGGRELKNDVIRIEIAPSLEESATLKTKEDWDKLLHEWMSEMEKVANKNDKKGKPKSLDFGNSQWIAMIHFDSGKPHIHLIVNRIRENGEINKDHHIGYLATVAANAVNEQRGWKQSKDVRKENIMRIYNDSIEVLKSMPNFNWDEYKQRMSKKGYNLSIRIDKEGKVVSYGIHSGNSYFISSSLGKNKELTAAHILGTWQRLHHTQSQTEVAVAKNQETSEDMITYEYHSDYGYYSSLSIPKVLDDILQREIIVPDEEYSDEDLDRDEEWEDELGDRDTVMEKAVKVFISLVVPSDNAVSSGGGGGVQGELSRWDGLPTERKDEYLLWARQAAQDASDKCKPRKKKMPRGYHL